MSCKERQRWFQGVQREHIGGDEGRTGVRDHLRTVSGQIEIKLLQQ